MRYIHSSLRIFCIRKKATSINHATRSPLVSFCDIGHVDDYFGAINCCIFFVVSVLALMIFVCFLLILVGFRALAISGVFCVLVVVLGQYDCF